MLAQFGWRPTGVAIAFAKSERAHHQWDQAGGQELLIAYHLSLTHLWIVERFRYLIIIMLQRTNFETLIGKVDTKKEGRTQNEERRLQLEWLLWGVIQS